MSINIRYPNISAVTPTEQLNQVKSYLHQLVEQLNYALPTLGGAGSMIDVQGANVSYYELRTLIIQELQEAETKIDRLTARLEADYVKKTDMDDLAAQAAEQIEFTLDAEGNLYYEVKEAEEN